MFPSQTSGDTVARQLHSAFHHIKAAVLAVPCSSFIYGHPECRISVVQPSALSSVLVLFPPSNLTISQTNSCGWWTGNQLYLTPVCCITRGHLLTPLLKIIEMNALGGSCNSAIVYFFFSREDISQKFFPTLVVSTRSETGRTVVLVLHTLGGSGMVCPSSIVIEF